MTLLSPLWLIVAGILLLLFLYARTNTRSDDWHRVLPAPVLEYLRPFSRLRRQRIWPLLAATIAALVLATPALERKGDDSFSHASAWIVMMDLSRSMTLDDTAPSRLSAARDAALQLAALAGSRPIALIGYAGDAFLLVAPALDKTAYREHANLLQHGLIDTEGSNPTRALGLATSLISGSKLVQSDLFFLTDSGGLGNKTATAARQLSAQGHNIHVLQVAQRTMAAGDTINTAMAERVAAAGNGRYLQANVLGNLPLKDLQRLATRAHERSSQNLLPTHIQLLYWIDQSHWLVLLLIPLTLLILWRSWRSV